MRLHSAPVGVLGPSPLDELGSLFGERPGELGAAGAVGGGAIESGCHGVKVVGSRRTEWQPLSARSGVMPAYTASSSALLIAVLAAMVQQTGVLAGQVEQVWSAPRR